MKLPATHLPAWLQRAMHAPCPIRVDFPDSGYVSVFPEQRLYETNISDLAGLSRLGDEAVQFMPLEEMPAARESLPLDQLHWTLALQRLQSQPHEFEFQYSVFRLQSWPSLAYLPQEIVPAIARICALLAHKPTTASLIPLMLDLPEAQVFSLLEVMLLNDHVQAQRLTASGSAGQRAGAAGDSESAPQQASPVERSLIARLWQRLASRH